MITSNQEISEVIQHLKKKALRISQDVMVTMWSVEQFSKRIANWLINSCNQCGICETVCSESIDMEVELLIAKHILFKDKSIQIADHDFWVREIAFTNSSDAYIFITPEQKPEQKIKSDYIFLPGVSLAQRNLALL